MKALRKWNAPLGVFQVLAVGIVLAGSMFAWILCLAPYLSSLLAPQTRFAQSFPFLYDIAHAAIAFMVLPWSFGLSFIALYCYQRHYDRKTQRQKTSIA